MNTKSTSDEVNHEAVLETGKNLVQGLIDGANSKPGGGIRRSRSGGGARWLRPREGGKSNGRDDK
jgi:hypothetical protein